MGLDDHTAVQQSECRIEIPVEVGLHEGNAGVCLTDAVNGNIEGFSNSIFASKHLGIAFLALFPFAS